VSVEGNQIEVQQRGEVTLLEFMGDVTTDSEAAFTQAQKRISDDGSEKILLKFKEDAHINSGGIALLIQLLQNAERSGYRVGITGLSDHFMKIFDLVGITKFAAIYPSEAEAIQAMSA
jgi:anti-anti-sigma factor